MPNPCNTFSPAPTSPSFAVGMAALPSADSTLPVNESSGALDASSSFDSVLAQIDDSTAPEEKMGSAIHSTSAPMTAEQLAMMVSMIAPNPALVPPMPVQSKPEMTDATSSFKLTGTEGRSIPELLVSGAEVLEYQAASLQGNASPLNAKSNFPGATVVQPGIQTPGTPQLSPAASSPELESNQPVSNAQLPDSGLALGKEGAIGALRFSGAPTINSAATSAQAPLAESATAPAAAPTGSIQTLDQSGRQNQNLDSSNLAVNTGILSSAVAAQGVAGSFKNSKQLLNERTEKIADSAPRLQPLGDLMPGANGKNVTLTVDGKDDEGMTEKVGTVAAKWMKTMAKETYISSPASRPTEGNSVDRLIGSGSGITPIELSEVSPSQATDLVHEIREIADGLWSVERNSVEVKFNFGEQEKLSVRVEYRDGTVRAIFRTDSPEIRDSITREWQAQAGVAEQRPYRVAEPVFAGGSSTSESFSGGDASRQQRSSDQQQPTPFARFIPDQSPRSALSTTAAPVVSPRETSGRLHVRA